ncbi:MAG: MotA/TolQ/ExbB proton channel family protein [Gemmatimonadota bacterium]|nr:MotA/TolQ/ExbB proton channel family protein [Gemmatimonadota bacterium]
MRHGTKVGSPSPGTSAVSPSEHFTVAGVLGRNLGSLPNALPGVFTAVGLLGTFVGIAMGLADIEPTAAAENLMEGIRTLMSGMSTAFVTSIVGITFSVWWLFEFRIAEGRFRSRLDLFIGETARVFRVEEPHETLMRVAISGTSNNG